MELEQAIVVLEVQRAILSDSFVGAATARIRMTAPRCHGATGQHDGTFAERRSARKYVVLHDFA